MLLNPPGELSRFAIVETFSSEDVDKIRFFEKIVPYARSEDNEYACAMGTLESDLNTNRIVYDPMNHYYSSVNYDSFMYDISTIEKFTYLRLDSKNEDHVKPHREISLNGYRQNDRKITSISWLSNDNEYEGGDLEIDLAGNLEPQKIELQKGHTVFFDAHVTWRITPVTSGELRCLVSNGWGKIQI